jgi:hypothetical protein
MIIDIEGVGLRDIPNDSSPDDIKRIVKKLTMPEPVAEPTLARKILPSVGRVVDIYKQETSEGMKAMEDFTEKPTGRSAIGALGGLVRYGFAPLTSFARGMVAEPIVNPVRPYVPKGVADFAQNTLEGAATMVPYGGLVRQASTALSTAQKAAQASSLIKNEIASTSRAAMKGVKKPLEFAEGTSPEIVAAVGQEIKGAVPKTPGMATDVATQTVAKTDVGKEVVDALGEAVAKTYKPGGEKRIGQELIDYISSNRAEIPKVLEKYGMTPEELAAEMKETYTLAGRHLGQLGALARRIETEFKTPEMQRLAASMMKDLPEPSTLDNFMSGFRKVENVRRAMLVGQAATTMRNIISQTGRMGLGAFDDALSGAIEGATSGGNAAVGALKGIGQGLDTVTALWHRVTPSGRKAFGELLEQDNALKAKALMYGSPIQDVVMGDKFTKAVNVLNRTQEFFFRNVAFEAKLNQSLEKVGVKGGLKGVSPTDIPESMFVDAAQHSLEMTFQAGAKTKTGRDFVQFMSQPYMTALLNPFPRFLWANSIPFLKDFSPLGFVKALDPKTVAKLASGDGAEFAKAASRATLGTTMLNGALYLRNNPELAGDKWYEVKVGGKSIDTRAFAPFSTYLFLAEAMVNPEKVKAADWGQALLSLNRVAGTGLVIVDVLRGKKFETVMNITNRIAGEWLGSFSTPIRTFKDLYTMVDPAESTIRDIREKELTGPTLRNIPEVSQGLPAAVNPLQQGPMKTETPVLRQLTGVSYRTKTPLETEVDRIQVDMSSVQPRTGVPEADRLIAAAMQPLSRQMEANVLKNPMYANAPPVMQKIMMRELFKEAKAMAKKEVFAANPILARKVLIKGVDEDINELFGNRLSEGGK